MSCGSGQICSRLGISTGSLGIPSITVNPDDLWMLTGETDAAMSKTVQKAFIEVNEVGTEAVVVTAHRP